MLAFPKVFFELQLNFAERVAPHFGLTFQDALFKYTALYVRLLGYNDQEPAKVSNPAWLTFIDALPDTRNAQVNFVFNRYQAFEETKTDRPGQEKFGCFSFSHHTDKNAYELHFANVDPEGNLGADRVETRTTDLKNLAANLQTVAAADATLFACTWLLNIEAFQRLMPPGLLAKTEMYTKDEAQTNAHWGQFVDRHGVLRTDLAAQLMGNAEKKLELINYYFPLKCLRAEIPVSEFVAHYQ